MDLSFRKNWILTHGLGLSVAICYFLIRCWVLRDYGFTIDEAEIRGIAKIYLQNFGPQLISGVDLNWQSHYMVGYYYLTDLIRVVIAQNSKWMFPGLGFARGFHLANLLFASASLFLVFEIVFILSKNVRPALLSTLALALLPQFIAHSQNNPKDLTGLFAFTLGVWSLALARTTRSWMWFGIACFGLGWCFTTTAFSTLLFPIAFLWLLIFERIDLRIRWPVYLGLFVGSCVVAFILWPWLWRNPLTNISFIIYRLIHYKFDIYESYMGEIQRVHDLPWHYVPAHLFASIPLPFLIGIFLGLGSWFKFKSMTPFNRSLLGLITIWFFIGLFDLSNSLAKCNALRHFLFILVPISILIGAGFNFLLVTFKSWVVWAGLGLTYLYVLVQVILIHPYQGAYLNEIANALIPAESERYFSVEYFGQAYQEGGQWLNEHAEPEGEIFVPIFTSAANFTLKKNARKGSLAQFLDPSKPRYLMFITRGSRYNEFIDYVQEHFTPVFEIRRQKAVLLKIYRNSCPLGSASKPQTVRNQKI